MKLGQRSSECYFLSFSFLSILFPEQTAGLIGSHGGIQDILAAMRGLPNEAEICANGCSALSCLTIHGRFKGTREASPLLTSLPSTHPKEKRKNIHTMDINKWRSPQTEFTHVFLVKNLANTKHNSYKLLLESNKYPYYNPDVHQKQVCVEIKLLWTEHFRARFVTWHSDTPLVL